MSEYTSLAIERQTWLYAKLLSQRSELSMAELTKRLMAMAVNLDTEQLNTMLFVGGQVDETIRHFVPEAFSIEHLDEQLNTNALLFGYLESMLTLKVE